MKSSRIAAQLDRECPELPLMLFGITGGLVIGVLVMDIISLGTAAPFDSWSTTTKILVIGYVLRQLNAEKEFMEDGVVHRRYASTGLAGVFF